jgi:protein-tyrosine phosphatase
MECLTLLFLCTGNYYRSRFAEILFNTLAQDTDISWRAESRGIAVDPGNGNIGPISKFAVQGLMARGISPEHPPRLPQQVNEHDLHRADYIIVLDETEHRPLLQQQFPYWLNRVTFWSVPDLDRLSAEDALAAIERHVKGLIQELRQNGHIYL